ncbi:MAG: hypothetical protein K9M57_01805, partial [Phycisphaerae bacterium]|nr:hypothetical protein [Phycisphaerae bacterium]
KDEEEVGKVLVHTINTMADMQEAVHYVAGDFLEGKYPQEDVQIYSENGQYSTNDAVMTFSKTLGYSKNGQQGGTVEVQLKYKDNPFNYFQKYVDKKWVDNLDVFLNQNPHGQYLVAYSQRSCTSRLQASREALDQAKTLATQKMVEDGRLRPGMTVSSKDIQRLITDRFTQALDGSQGKIWREALLLDFSPGRYDPTANNARMSYWVSLIFSAVALTALICGIYFVLNIATSGHYTWVLRIAIAILVLGALLAFVTIG